MTNFNNTRDAVPITKEDKITIRTKLQVLGLEPVDVPADGNRFLYAARFALMELNDWNITVVPTVAKIRENITSFLALARTRVIWDDRTLDAVRAGMSDQVTVGRRRITRL